MLQGVRFLRLAVLAGLTVLALPGIAQAQFTSTKAHTILSGSQKMGTNDVFTAGEGFGGVACENVIFAGTGTHTPGNDAMISPAYSNCKDSFGRTVDIDNSALAYTLTSGVGKGTVHVSGSLTLTITSGGAVVCTVVTSSPQTNTGVSYINLGGTNGVEVTLHMQDVKSTTSGGFFNCGVSNGEHTNGTYDGVAVVTGKDTSGAAVSISVD